MYIFGYLFEKEYFEGSLKKGHTDTENFEEADDSPANRRA